MGKMQHGMDMTLFSITFLTSVLFLLIVVIATTLYVFRKEYGKEMRRLAERDEHDSTIG